MILQVIPVVVDEGPHENRVILGRDVCCGVEPGCWRHVRAVASASGRRVAVWAAAAAEKIRPSTGTLLLTTSADPSHILLPLIPVIPSSLYYSAMDRDKKRSSLTDHPQNGGISLSTMASSYLPLHHTAPRSAATSRTRPSTPPASTYFTTFAGDPQQEPIPTPDAPTHFAFSTTLVRRAEHSPVAGRHDYSPVEGLVDKVLGRNKGAEYHGLEGGNGHALPNGVPLHGNETTSSSRFAHQTIEVSNSLINLAMCSILRT